MNKGHVMRTTTMVALAIALSAFLSVRGNPKSPNVVLIFSDDMGYADGTGNTEIPVPNLERLAHGGVRFTGAYVSAPICVASRMGLMSGCHQQRFGLYCNIYGEQRNRLFLKHTLLPKVFQDAGYQTGLVGKWHLSGNNPKRFDYGHPLERGFDEFVGLGGGGSSFWKGSPLYRGTKPIKAPRYLTDFFGDEACEFMERNKENPFFLYLAFNAVHSPMHSLEEDKVKGNNKSPMRETYGGMMTAMDRNVGRVLDKIDSLGLKNDTIVIFINDNGGGGSTDFYASHSRNYADNSPYKGHKFDLYEGGIRTPFYMRWPGRIKEGSVYKEMVSSMDIFPTVVKAAGLKLPEQARDGTNLMPHLDRSLKKAPHPWLCWENRNWAQSGDKKYCRPDPQRRIHNGAIRKDNWKLVRYFDLIDSKDAPPAWQLYDLSKDASEKTDVAKHYPKVVKELNQIFTEWRASMHPSMEDK